MNFVTIPRSSFTRSATTALFLFWAAVIPARLTASGGAPVAMGIVPVFSIGAGGGVVDARPNLFFGASGGLGLGAVGGGGWGILFLKVDLDRDIYPGSDPSGAWRYHIGAEMWDSKAGTFAASYANVDGQSGFSVKLGFLAGGANFYLRSGYAGGFLAQLGVQYMPGL